MSPTSQDLQGRGGDPNPRKSHLAGMPNLSQVTAEIRAWLMAWLIAWNHFWFTPRRPTTLGIIRIATGLIVLYSQLVWTLEFSTFLSDKGMLPSDYRQLFFGTYAWSHFDFVKSDVWLWLIHWLGLVVVGMFIVGWFTRTTAILTTLLLISYTNRATGALFGLDQIMVLLCLYLSVGRAGGAFSVDCWLASRQGRSTSPDVCTNIAIRLIQLHLCLIYFYAGLGKLQGETWWNGQAIWFSVASFEYQTWDLTWLANHMEWVALLTLITVYWEVTYPALIWFRLTRPIMLGIAFFTHIGIGLAMGMLTFGMVMLVANFSFIELNHKHKLTNSANS